MLLLVSLHWDLTEEMGVLMNVQETFPAHVKPQGQDDPVELE